MHMLLASDPSIEDGFGVRVGISGETIVVGAPAVGQSGRPEPGAVYIFARNGTSWPQRQKITADDGFGGDRFGFALAISGETIVVGAQNALGADGFAQGAAYVFATPTNTAPVASCRNVTVAAGIDCRAAASIDNGSFDPDGDSITITQSPPDPYLLGATTVKLTVTDSFGASSSCSAVVKVADQTAPVVKASAKKADNTPYVAGTWTNQTVTVRFDCSDFCSGIVSCPADVVLDATGVIALASGSATDGAGNKGSAGFGPIMIDKTPPVVSLTGVTPGATYPLGAVPAAACNTTDAHSGVATAATLVVGGGNAQGVGTFNVGCVGATDNVGNRSPLAAFLYTVAYNMNKFVALAQEGVELEQRVSVLNGDVGARARSAGPFIRDGVEVSVGQQVEMLNPNSHLLGDSIFIRQGANVYNPSYNDLTNQGTILGAPVTPLTLSLIPALPALPAITPGKQNFEVEQQGTLTLGAGDYGALVARQLATITFTGGVYHFQSWDVGQLVKLHFLAPTEIRIAGRLRVDQRSYLGPAPSAAGLAARDIVIYVAGRNGQTGSLGAVPEAAAFGQETTLNANVVVPNGTLRLLQRVEATGAFFGKWVRAGQQVKLTLDSRFGL
ncbi:MAG: FG-GAP repeat protein [Blastocatellia bacterium]